MNQNQARIDSRLNSAWITPLILTLLSLVSLLILSQIDGQFWQRQALFMVLGAGLFYGASQIQPTVYLKHSLALYVMLNLILLTTLVFGSGRGTHRWIEVAGVTFQASQLAVPLVGLLLTRLWQTVHSTNIRQLFISLAAIAFPAGLIFLEPDLGTSLWFLLPASLTLFVAGLRTKYIFLLLMSTLILAVVAFHWILKPYQKERLLGFTKPSYRQETSSASVYNRHQALIAIGSGGLVGKGIGAGTQSQLKFLPEKHTDFIFATLTEEGGIILAVIVIGLYSLLILTMFQQVKVLKPPNNLFVFYIASLFAWQVIINLGGNLGLLPITGLPLPFLSYGGSSIISWAITLGVVSGLSQSSL